MASEKKKKKKGADDPAKAEAAAPEPLPGEGTPEGELLREANAAFEAGNFAMVREIVAKLASAPDPKVADAASDLRRRIAVDPLQIGLLAACAVAFLVIVWIYVLS
jgi:hypothetical protein